HSYVQFKILKYPGNGILHDRMNLIVAGTGHADSSNSRDVDGAIAIHYGAIVNINLSPHSDKQLITGADQVVRSNRHAIERRKSRRHGAKQILSEDREVDAEGAGDKILKLNVWFGRQI